ncbi:MAG: HAD-like domain-containing protein, partial [Piptocephalis tieghemiana]
TTLPEEMKAKPLVILDLNGTLLLRGKSKPRKITLRPHLPSFLSFLFTHFSVMVWSSARPESVDQMAQHVFEDRIRDLAAIWDRRSFLLGSAYYHDSPTIKDLAKIWEWQPCWGASNTLILDDSIEKIIHPANWISINTW